MSESPVDLAGIDALWTRARAKRGLDPDCVFCHGTTTELESPFCSDECLRASDRAETTGMTERLDALEERLRGEKGKDALP